MTTRSTNDAQIEHDVAAVSRVTRSLLNAVNSSDLPGVLAAWCDDGVTMPPGHPSLRGRSAIEAYFANLFRQRRFEFAFTSSAIQIAGDVALERRDGCYFRRGGVAFEFPARGRSGMMTVPVR